MKKGELIITAMVVVAAIGSAFAVNVKRIPASIYYKPAGATTYTLIQCTLVQTPALCSYQQTKNNAYYTFNGISYTVIPNGSLLFIPVAQ
jgi:hypothetical protein